MFNIQSSIPISGNPYPEREDQPLLTGYDFYGRLGIDSLYMLKNRAKSFRWLPPRVYALVRGMELWDDKKIIDAGRKIGAQLRAKGFKRDLIARSFALVAVTARKHMGMGYRDAQLMGGCAMLKGMVSEMEEGEEKTLVAALPACTLAIAGVPVHIITLSDYIAKRSAEQVSPVCRALGLTVGAISPKLSSDERREAYRCNIVYCAGKEIIFDYLRDYLIFNERPSQVRLKIDRLYGEKSKTDQLLLRGLHYAIVDDADTILIDKANIPIAVTSENNQTRARIRYQLFFRRYQGLAGMTSTAREVAGELRRIYKLCTVSFPPHSSVQSKVLPNDILPTAEKKWDRILTVVSNMHQKGRPVLIGVRSKESSEIFSSILTETGLNYKTVNDAGNEEDVQDIVQSGQPGRITVVTPMALGNLPIPLGPGVAEIGGIHVIASERSESPRFDKKLFGMCGAQGQPGSCQAIVSLEDDLIVSHAPKWLILIATRLLSVRIAGLFKIVSAVLFHAAQRQAEKKYSLMIQEQLEADQQMRESLAFSGRPE